MVNYESRVRSMQGVLGLSPDRFVLASGLLALVAVVFLLTQAQGSNDESGARGS